MNEENVKNKEGILYKSKDSLSSLYKILSVCNFSIINNKFVYYSFWKLKYYNNNQIKKDVIKTITVISKKYTSDVINCDCIKNSYKDILPSYPSFPKENRKYIIFMFKEMVKEGILKKGEEGTEIIEEILFIAQMMKENKSKFNIKEEDYINTINDYIITAKENGFVEKVTKNKNEILIENTYFDWKVIVKRNVWILIFIIFIIIIC